MARSSFTWLSLALVAGVLALWLLSRSDPGVGGEPLTPTAAGSALEVESAALGAIGLAPDAEGARDQAAPTEGAGVELVVPAADLPSSVELASIRGRLLLPGGAPAAGGLLRVSTWKLTSWWFPGEDPRASGYEGETASAHDGRFELDFHPPPGHVVELRASLRGHGEAHWQWDAIDPGELLDVGDVTLAPAGTLLVRIVDSAGQPVPGSWRVRVGERRPFREDDGRTAAHLFEDVDPITGSAVFENVRAGRARVHAYWELADTLYADVRVEAGSMQEVELRYLGPDPSRRIVVLPACDPFYSLRPEGAFVLRGEGLERRCGGSYEFDDLPPGTYSIALEDERFEPWSADGLQPGEAVVARLRGAAALVLNLVDATDGSAIERYALSIELEDPFWAPEPFLIQELGAEPPPGGIFRGLGPIPQTAIIEAPGYARALLPILDLRPGERRALDVRLWPALRIAGEVVHADGSPAAGVTVQIVEPGAPPEPPSEECEETDRAGRFALEGLAPGTFTLHAHSNPWLVRTLEGIVLSEGSSLEDLRIELPPHARIRGHVLAPPGARDEDLTLSFRPAGEPAFDDSHYGDAPAVQVPIAPDRSFDSGPLPPGRIEVLLWREIGPMDPLGFVATRETELRELDLAPGAVADVELDLFGLWPARLLVHLEWQEAHRDGYWVVAFREPDSLAAVSDNRGVAEDGTVELGPLDPGPYWVFVFANGVPGSWPAPAPMVLEPGTQHELRLPVHLASGEITLLGAVGGPPLAGARVMLSDGWQSGFWVEADEEGRLHLEMPPGRYALSMSPERGSGAGRRATLEWGATGPTSASLVLEPEGSDPARSR